MIARLVDTFLLVVISAFVVWSISDWASEIINPPQPECAPGFVKSKREGPSLECWYERNDYRKPVVRRAVR